MKLTEEEKDAVALYLNSPDTKNGYWGHYAAWITPSILICVYGLVKLEPIAIGVGYVSLLLMVIWYLVYSERTSKPLISALRKYQHEFAESEESD